MTKTWVNQFLRTLKFDPLKDARYRETVKAQNKDYCLLRAHELLGEKTKGSVIMAIRLLIIWCFLNGED